MKAVPVVRFDAGYDWILRPFLGYFAAGGDGHEQPIDGAFVIDFVRDFACGFPFFCSDILSYGVRK